jgi:phosphoribosyl-dephospho-CoA transferase
MSFCQFCREKAGILKKEHKQCREIYKSGKNRLKKMIMDLLLGDAIEKVEIETIKELCSKSFIDEKERNIIISDSMELSIGTLIRTKDLEMLQLGIENLYSIGRFFDISIYDLDISKIRYVINHFCYYI